ncbi:tRNA (cytosine-5-)-methyltransferase [Phlyctochytrium bullatum]|nr:tRNA (cytosine-5-)-methyltransferase [Phlyctochytrium bullatum]
MNLGVYDDGLATYDESNSLANLDDIDGPKDEEGQNEDTECFGQRLPTPSAGDVENDPKLQKALEALFKYYLKLRAEGKKKYLDALEQEFAASELLTKNGKPRKLNAGLKKLIDEKRGRWWESMGPCPLSILRLRFFSPKEVAKLHGFPAHFDFPSEVTDRQRFQLLGNSLNVKVVEYLVRYLFTD